ncbi:MAG: hypothetical protein QOE45_3058 [Frankiaceae bacterium]|nr:hypothetical protein [Frankiaceae bacterium]
MPVVVTAAETPLGRLVVERLLADGAEVRAVVGSVTGDLGVPTSRTDWRDAERLGAVLEGAHTVIHLAGERHVADLLAAAEDSGLRRIVVVARGPVPGLEGAPYDVVVVPDTRRRLSRAVDPGLVEALVAADRRR